MTYERIIFKVDLLFKAYFNDANWHQTFWIVNSDSDLDSIVREEYVFIEEYFSRALTLGFATPCHWCTSYLSHLCLSWRGLLFHHHYVLLSEYIANTFGMNNGSYSIFDLGFSLIAMNWISEINGWRNSLWQRELERYFVVTDL